MEVRLKAPWPTYETTVGLVRHLLRLQNDWRAVVTDKSGRVKCYPSDHYKIQEGDILMFDCS